MPSCHGHGHGRYYPGFASNVAAMAASKEMTTETPLLPPVAMHAVSVSIAIIGAPMDKPKKVRKKCKGSPILMGGFGVF